MNYSVSMYPPKTMGVSFIHWCVGHVFLRLVTHKEDSVCFKSLANWLLQVASP